MMSLVCLNSSNMIAVNSDGFLCKDNNRPYLNLQVDNPRTEHNGRSYTTYQITVESNYLAFTLTKSRVRRRYSEFVWLQKNLEQHHCHLQIPSLPGKTYCRPKLSTSVVKRRVKELHTFLSRLLGEMEFLSDNSLHLFLQSPMSISEMEVCLNGRSSNVVPDVIKMCAQLYDVSNFDVEMSSKHLPVESMLRNLEYNTSTPRRVPCDSPRCAEFSLSSPTSPSSIPEVSFIIGSDSVEDEPAPILKAHRETIVRFSLEDDYDSPDKNVKAEGVKESEDSMKVGRKSDCSNIMAQDVQVQDIDQCNDISKNAQTNAKSVLKHSLTDIAQTDEDNNIKKEHIEKIESLVGDVNQNNKNIVVDSSEKQDRLCGKLDELDTSKTDTESVDSGLTSPSVEIERCEEYLFSDLPTGRSVIKIGIHKEETTGKPT